MSNIETTDRMHFNSADYEGLIKNYDFVAELDQEMQDEFFHNFGPNWAYHIVNEFKIKNPTLNPNGLRAIDFAREATMRGHDICSGNLLNVETLRTYWLWNPYKRADMYLSLHPGMTLAAAEDFIFSVYERRDTRNLVERIPLSKTFEVMVADWCNRIRRWKEDPLFPNISKMCEDCANGRPWDRSARKMDDVAPPPRPMPLRPSPKIAPWLKPDDEQYMAYVKKKMTYAEPVIRTPLEEILSHRKLEEAYPYDCCASIGLNPDILHQLAPGQCRYENFTKITIYFCGDV
jgi:hypothetical protein